MVSVRKNHQRGYGGLGMLIAGGIVAIIMYFFFYPTKFPHAEPVEITEECVASQPSTTNTITLNGVTYGLIKEHAAIIRGEFDLHLKPDGKVENYWKDGETRNASKPIENIAIPGKPLASEWDVTAFNLRFVDMTDTRPYLQKGMGIYDVYLKLGDEIPAFIKAYCNRVPEKDKLFVLQGVSKSSFPPISFNTKDIKNIYLGGNCLTNRAFWDLRKGCEFAPDTTYYLFAYEPRRTIDNENLKGADSTVCSPQGACGVLLHGDVDMIVDGKPKKFRVEFFPNAVKLLIVFDLDPASPYYGYQFDYAPEEFIKAADLDTLYPSGWDDKTLQLRAFAPFQLPAWGWWTPECKPAVYLYPRQTMAVNVQVKIKDGFLTYTDPAYPQDRGWTVLANPNGDLRYLGNTFTDSRGSTNYPTGIFPYLYYEGKVADSAVQKPDKGFVIAYDQLESFYDELLPKLGLNQKESKEFKDYWLKALPKASYYFIGIIPQATLEGVEPLTITPKEDTMIRVRLYFEQREKFVVVTPPTLKTPTRTGFTVVDWGGMVKQDPSRPFTCLQ